MSSILPCHPVASPLLWVCPEFSSWWSRSCILTISATSFPCGGWVLLVWSSDFVAVLGAVEFVKICLLFNAVSESNLEECTVAVIQSVAYAFSHTGTCENRNHLQKRKIGLLILNGASPFWEANSSWICQEIPRVLRIPKFISAFTAAYNFSLFRDTWIQSAHSHPVSFKSILISSHLRLSSKLNKITSKMDRRVGVCQRNGTGYQPNNPRLYYEAGRNCMCNNFAELFTHLAMQWEPELFLWG
jgi:hypothetical protein